MTYDQEQKDRAREEEAVLYKAEFDFRFIEGSRRPAKKTQQWGRMPLERAQRIRAILNEDC